MPRLDDDVEEEAPSVTEACSDKVALDASAPRAASSATDASSGGEARAGEPARGNRRGLDPSAEMMTEYGAPARPRAHEASPRPRAHPKLARLELLGLPGPHWHPPGLRPRPRPMNGARGKQRALLRLLGLLEPPWHPPGLRPRPRPMNGARGKQRTPLELLGLLEPPRHPPGLRPRLQPVNGARGEQRPPPRRFEATRRRSPWWGATPPATTLRLVPGRGGRRLPARPNALQRRKSRVIASLGRPQIAQHPGPHAGTRRRCNRRPERSLGGKTFRPSFSGGAEDDEGEPALVDGGAARSAHNRRKGEGIAAG